MNSVSNISQSRSAKEMALLMKSEDDADRIQVVLGQRLAKSIFDNKADDTLYWAIVHARLCGERVNARTRCDLLSLLDEGEN